MRKSVVIGMMELIVALAITGSLHGQAVPVNDTSGPRMLASAQRIDEKSLQALNNKYGNLETTVNGQSMKLLNNMEKLETNMEGKLMLKDTMAAKQLFGNVRNKYEALKASLTSPVTKIIPRPLQEYIPRLDSLQTVMHFLSQPTAGIPGMSAAKLQQIQALSSQLQQLQGRFQQAGAIQDFVRGREQLLQAQLAKFGMAGKLLTANKQLYYYQQQLSAYKQLFDDRSKLEQAALGYATQLPVFKGFMQKNSYLGQLFPMPQDYGTPKALAGVPTSADVGNMIAQKTGSAGTKIDPQQYLQEQAQSGEDQLSALKDKVMKAGGGNSDMELPQFTPNSQKTRSFLKRLEFGFNVQSQQNTTFLPVMTDFALTVGYRFSDRVVAGVGGVYQMGWGSGWQHIAVSNQGVGLRSYLDVKAKGSIWITGGFEYDYMQEFAKWADIRNLDIWQKSVLLGLTKKYKVGKLTGNVQLLYDFLAKYETPAGSPLKFRVGYNF